MPFTRMKAEKSSPIWVSPTPNAALIWLLLPRTMYWSIPSMKRVKPTTHMGQFVTTIRRGEAAVRCAAGAVPDTTDSATAAPDPSAGTATAGERSGVGPASATLTSDPFSARPVCPWPQPPPGRQSPGV